MAEIESWDWWTEEKCIANLNEWRTQFQVVQEFAVSNDGEKIAAVVEIENKKAVPCVNGKIWENTYERVWPLRFSPDGRLVCAALQNYEWTLIVDQAPWEETYDFVWNLTFSPDGKYIAVNIKKDNEFGISLNGRAWENKFFEARDVIMSPDGRRTASRVKTKRVASLDIMGYADKVLTVAVDGNPWDTKFLSIWGITFSPDGGSAAAGVKLKPMEFTIAVDGVLWQDTFLLCMGACL